MKVVKLTRVLVSLLLTVLVALHVVGYNRIELLDRFSNILYDLRLKATLDPQVDTRLVIVDIDEKSLASEGRWPWHRDKLSFLLDMLFDYYGVELVAFDVAFPEPDDHSDSKIIAELQKGVFKEIPLLQEAVKSLKSDFAYDQNFANSIAGRNVVMGYFIGSTDDVSVGLLPAPLIDTGQLPFAEDLFDGKSYGANLSLFQTAAYNGGYFNNPYVDEDGVYRRYPIIATLGGQVFSSLPLAIVHALLQNSDIQFKISQGYSDQTKLEMLLVDSFRIPVDANAAIKIPYKGPFKTFDYVSVTDVLSATADSQLLSGRIAIIGTTAAGLFDLRATPVQNIFPGVEIHANIVSGILDQTIKSRPAYLVAAELVELLVFALLVTFLFPRLAASWMTVLLLVSLIAIAAVDYYFWISGVDFHSAAVLVLIFWLYMVQMFFGYFFEVRKKNALSRVFGRYIPSEIVNEIAKKDIKVKLSGESRQMTVFFSDVRNFTSIAESLDSQELTKIINEILTQITAVIYRNRGTIDKYMGDAVMAFWGAPLTIDNHAELAVTSAIEVIEKIHSLRPEFADKGWPAINVGVGINSGRMSVGNMGSEYRMSYTVMGDAVNLGSRLEGLTKLYGVEIIISAATREQVPGIVCRELDRVRVKGKAEPITIYQPIGKRGLQSDELIKELRLFEDALGAYRQQHWTEALHLFLQLQKSNPDLGLYQLYLERIDNYRRTPPGPDWDGVYTHTAK